MNDELLMELINEDFGVDYHLIYPKYIKEQKPKIYFHIVIAQGREGIIPRLHMYFRHKEDKDQRYISYICLHEAEYVPHHKDGKRLTEPEKKALIEFFNTFRKSAATLDKNGNLIPCNCWQECVDVWLATYDDSKKLFKRDNNRMVIMPDYTKL